VPATTPIYGLPYMVGTDPPCFGPGAGCDNLESLFCQFAELVEVQLDENDDIIGRTATAIPMAQVSLTPVAPDNNLFTLEGVGNFLPFDTVEFDTDDMADLPRGIQPRRDGLYRFELLIQMLGGMTAQTNFAMNLIFGTELDAAILAAEAVVPPTLPAPDVHGATLYSFSGITGPFPRTPVTRIGSLFGTTATLQKATLSCYWHSDL